MKKIQFTVSGLLLLIALFLAVLPVSGLVCVGVQEGHWVEYDVNISTNQTGTSGLGISPEHNVFWARIEITTIQVTKLYLNITSQYENGTITFENIILNLETGVVGDDFIIPANLTLGDEFFDINQGNITITDIEEKTIAGSQRSIIKGNTNETSYCWDQKSGMLVSAITITPNYTMKTSLNATNIWKTQESVAQNSSFTLSWFDFNLDLTTIFALTVGVIAIIIIIMSSVILRRHKLKTKET